MPHPNLPDLLLDDGDPPPVEVIPGEAGPLVVVCDHGGRAVPRRLARLGLAHTDLARHIAWDIGAAAMAERLAARYSATLVRAAYSRLVIDPNRYPGDPASIAASSDGTPVPGNSGVSHADRERRVAEIFRPYHDRIAPDPGRSRRAPRRAAAAVGALHD